MTLPEHPEHNQISFANHAFDDWGHFKTLHLTE